MLLLKKMKKKPKHLKFKSQIKITRLEFLKCYHTLEGWIINRFKLLDCLNNLTLSSLTSFL